jgi:tetratricopeptide (TPR) repeat protein
MRNSLIPAARWLVSASSAFAITDNFRDCEQENDIDLKVVACSDIINRGSARAEYLAAAYAGRGNAYAEKGEFDRAISDFDRAIELNTKDAEFHTWRGETYADKETWIVLLVTIAALLNSILTTEAYTDGRRLYQQGRSCSNQIRTKARGGICGTRLGLTQKATEGLLDIERALLLERNDPDALNIRGHIFEALGRKDQAIADYYKALSIEPSLEASKDALKRLGRSSPFWVSSRHPTDTSAFSHERHQSTHGSGQYMRWQLEMRVMEANAAAAHREIEKQRKMKWSTPR